MLTKERIEELASGVVCEVSSDEVDALYAMALGHLDSSRARRVGEAVVASGITAEWCEKHLRDLRNARGSMSLSSPAYERAFTMEIALFDAIAAALRGEP